MQILQQAISIAAQSAFARFRELIDLTIR